MKIWYQSMSSYRYEEHMENYGKNLEEQCRRAARPGTEIYVTGVPVHTQLIDRYRSLMYFHANQGLNNMLKAEKEGYDAFVIGCSFDVNLAEGREMLSIPVLGIAQSNMFMAAMMGELFAIVTCQPFIAEKYRQLAIRYGLENKHLRGDYVVPITEEDMAKLLHKPEALAGKFKAKARKAVADGASVIIPVPAHISQLFYKTEGLTNLDGATVLDPVAVAIKFAEAWVDLKKLGIEVSRTYQVYASPGKELLKKNLETYAPVFKIGW